jgi:hypothetical protein
MKSLSWYKNAVQVKLEEISPFETESYIIAGGDPDYDKVNPIKSYIENTLPEATKNCLRTLPLSLLHADIERTTKQIAIDKDGVGRFIVSPDRRFVSFYHEELERDITTFITSEDPMYLIMQNKHVRPKQAKALAVLSSNVTVDVGTMAAQMEIYTLKPSESGRTTSSALQSIDLTKLPGVAADYTPATPALVQSPIEELIVLECAAMVSDIMHNNAAAEACRQEFQSKVENTLK